MRFRLAWILAVGALLAVVVGTALAAKPKAGSVYSSTPSAKSPSVYFKAASAEKLTSFSAGLALKCKEKVCGGFGGIRSFSRNSVAVSKTGTFKVTGNILAVDNKKLGTEVVTGKFVSATEVKGTVTTHANLGQYVGISESYTARATVAGK